MQLAPTRDPSKSELEWFRLNPHVGGYASFEDGHVVVNPFNTLTPEENEALIRNESARLFMRKHHQARPTFETTPQQRQMNYPQYAAPAHPQQSLRETVAARAVSGDPSAGNITPEQASFVEELKARMGTR